MLRNTFLRAAGLRGDRVEQLGALQQNMRHRRDGAHARGHAAPRARRQVISNTCKIFSVSNTYPRCRHCPALRDYKWCGSARNCNKGYFSW